MTAETNPNRRVALLARPGEACERLRAVLHEAGAQCVLAADPTQLDPAALLDAEPQVVLVALDPFTEEVLERFDSVLADPSIDVIYEEADLTAAREGWAIARWQRHLVAKLHGHADVLPPGREPDGFAAARLAPGAVARAPHPAAPANLGFDAFDAEADASLDDFDLDLIAEAPLSPADATPAEAFAFDDVFDSVAAEMPATAAGLAGERAMSDSSAGIDFSSELALIDAGPVTDIGQTGLDVFDPESLEVTVETFVAAPATDSVEAARQFKHDLGDLEHRISTLELVDDTPKRGPERARGAVLVLSGIGGPDAVRQLLGALPADFARPVLVQQRLDGGRYDKLVTQLQRTTALPVQLAEPGQPALARVVYILPASVGIEAGADGLCFNNDAHDNVLAALPSADSAVLLLSGSDPAHVDAVMNHSWAGAFVAGQAADGCYDAAAPDALAARGADTAPPAKLALRLAERWPSRGTEDAQA